MLVVGVVGDAEILRNKGPPVYTEEERCVPSARSRHMQPACPASRARRRFSLIMVESVKWVDEVLKDVPYDVSESFMQTLFDVRAPHARPQQAPRSRSRGVPSAAAEAQH